MYSVWNSYISASKKNAMNEKQVNFIVELFVSA